MTVHPSSADHGIPQSVRRVLSKLVLELRTALEEDFRRQLTALGLRDGGVQPLPPGRTLPAPDQRAREIAGAVIQREVEGGASPREALDRYVRESAYTFLNRVVGLRCLEERALLLVDGQPESAIRQDPARGASSLYWRVRNELPPATNPREVWRQTLHRAWTALSQQVKVLFDPDSEYAALLPLLPTIQKVVDGLNSPEVPPESYAQDELLGWVYQYYNAQEKDAVYAGLSKGNKLEKPEAIAAATCLYTERYMVDYLLQNTLGALWVQMRPDSALPVHWPYFVAPAVETGPPAVETAGNENEVRLRGLPGSQPAQAGFVPVARDFSRTGRRLRDVTLLDPACGSGHFLVRAFDLLVEMYREEGLEPETEIPHLILERNLHGIDIDPRAVQIAALGLYLKARAHDGPDFRPRRLNLIAADALLPGDAPPARYMARFQGERETEELVKGLWQGLRHVREYGSLLHPERAVEAAVKRRRERDRGGLWEHDDAHWEQWKRDLLAGLREEFERESQSEDLGQRLFGEEAARGVSLVEALGRRYDVVVANPPYAGSKNFSLRLKSFVEHEYREGKGNLYAAFILRCRDFCRPGGYVGMVTQQAWLFQRSYAVLRKDTIAHDQLLTLAHLGPYAFEEIGGAVVNVALLTMRALPPAHGHCLAGFRLVAAKSSTEKDFLLRRCVSDSTGGFAPEQVAFLDIPEAPLVYWLRPQFFSLLKGSHRLGSVAGVKEGLGTRDDERFLRSMWEVQSIGEVVDSRPLAGRWFWCAKGGGYRRWAGLMWVVVDWEENGRRIKGFQQSVVRNPSFQFRRGLTYSLLAQGNMGVRMLDAAMFNDTAPSMFLHQDRSESLASIASLCNTHVVSYLLRTTTQDLKFRPGYVINLPLPSVAWERLDAMGRACVALKLWLVSLDLLERQFERAPLEILTGSSLGHRWLELQGEVQSVETLLSTVEGLNERFVCQAYGLDEGDVGAVLDETSRPAGWYPMIPGYDSAPMPPEHLSVGVEPHSHQETLETRSLTAGELGRLKARLRAVYQAGTGARVQEVDQDNGSGEDAEQVALGARIPIPTETFLEELSQKLEIHPISVYWLLKEMREQEGLVCPPELKRHMEDYVSVSLLRLLGYRWPEQDGYELEHGPILDPALVDDDGIIPLVACGKEPTAEELVRARLERDFGQQGAEESVREFRQWVGRDLGEWLRRDCFKRHVQQFKQRPIAWHLTSPEGTFQAFVLYHRLSRATLQALRARYAGSLIERLRSDLERARQRGASADVTRLQLQIEDVEEFRSRLEKIERGDELKHRIRCRWKGEDAAGRPGPYAPDIDDGVKVNIRPFQEAGLLAMREVIKKW